MDTNSKIFENMSVDELEKFKKVFNALIDEELKKRTPTAQTQQATVEQQPVQQAPVQQEQVKVEEKSALENIKEKISSKITAIKNIASEIKSKIANRFYNSKDKIMTKTKEQLDKIKNEIQEAKKLFANDSNPAMQKFDDIYNKTSQNTSQQMIQGANIGKTAKGQDVTLYNPQTMIQTKVKDKVGVTERIISCSKEKIEILKQNIKTIIDKLKAPIEGIKDKTTIMAYDIQIEGLKLGISAKKQAIKIYNAAEVLKTKAKDKIVDKKDKILTFTSEKLAILKQGIKNIEMKLSAKVTEVKKAAQEKVDVVKQAAQEKVEGVKQAAQEKVQAVKDKGKELALPVVKLGKSVKNQTIFLFNAASNLKTKAKDKICETKDRVITAGKEKAAQIKEGIKNTFAPTPEKLQEYKEMIDQRKKYMQELQQRYGSVGNNEPELATAGVSR